MSPDYTLVPREKTPEFITKVEQAIKSFFPNGVDTVNYTAIVLARHPRRLQGMIKEAEDRGTKVLRIGDTHATSAGKEAPALLIDPPLDNQAMQEEVFGPILLIILHDIVEEEMAIVAERAPPLALDIFTEKYAERDTWLKKSLSGGV